MKVMALCSSAFEAESWNSQMRYNSKYLLYEDVVQL